MLWLIEREALNIVQELYKLSAYNCSKVLGFSSSFVTVGCQIPCGCEHFLFAAVFSRLAVFWWFRGVFCVCFVLFEGSMKLRETAIEQESLKAAYSFLN